MAKGRETRLGPVEIVPIRDKEDPSSWNDDGE